MTGNTANRRFILLILLLFAFFLSYSLLLTAASANNTVESLVETIQNKNRQIAGMQGNFSQTSYLKDLDRTEKYEGEFFIKKPSNMKWSYSDPRDEEITISGNETWIYKKSEKQVLKTTFSKDAYGQVPIALLGSLNNLKDDFDITLVKDGTLELKPKKQMGFMDKIHLETSSNDFPVKTFTIFDTAGNIIVIEIRRVKINPGFDDAFFIFKVPPGVEVYDFSR